MKVRSEATTANHFLSDIRVFTEIIIAQFNNKSYIYKFVVFV